MVDLQVCDVNRRGTRKSGFLTVQGVVRHVKTEHVSLEFEFGLSRPFRSVGYEGNRLVKEFPEIKANVALRCVFLYSCGVFGDLFVDVDECPTGVSEPVKGSRLDERFECSLVERGKWDSIEEVLKRRVRSVCASFAHNVFDHCFTDVLD